MLKRIFFYLVLTLLAACGGGGGNNSPAPPQQFAVSVTVSGLANGEQFVAEINGSTQVTVQQNGSATFNVQLDNGTDYTVTITEQPRSQSCTLQNASGTIQGANVTNVSVTCVGFEVRGRATGVVPGNTFRLDLNGEQQVTVTDDSDWAFPTTLPDQTNYNVTVMTSSGTQTCVILNGTGTISSEDVTNISLECDSYRVGGTVRGLSEGESLVVRLNDFLEVPLSVNGPYEFVPLLLPTEDYTVTLISGPTKKVCEIENGTGSYNGANVDDANITCRVPFARATLTQDLNQNPFIQSGNPATLTRFGDQLLQVAANPDRGTEPYLFDPELGTSTFLGDIREGVDNSLAAEFTDSGAGWAVFRADDGITGAELWITDGTAAGTELLLDIFPGPGSSTPRNFYPLGGMIYFVASDGVAGRELWRTDGTTVGTSMLIDLDPIGDGVRSGGASFFRDLDGELYFIATQGAARHQVWASDGTVAGTRAVTDVQTPGLAVNQGPWFLEPFQGEMYFLWGDRLFATDGDDNFSREVVDADNNLFRITAVNNALYFAANTSPELWVSDGTTVGTTSIDIDSTGFGPANFLAFNGEVAFRSGGELWLSDGTALTTRSITDGVEGDNLLLVDNLLLFNRETPTEGRELWSYDGVAPALVADLQPGDEDGLIIFNGVEIAGQAFFNAENDIVGRELFMTDGTASGTVLAANFGNDTATQVGASQIAGSIGSDVYLSIREDSSWEVARYDTVSNTFTTLSNFNRLTESFTMFVTSSRLWLDDNDTPGLFTTLPPDTTFDIVPNAPDPSNFLGEFNNQLVYSAQDLTFRNRLTLSDGTELGTAFVNGVEGPGDFTQFGEFGLFAGSVDGLDQELWRLDQETPSLVANLSTTNNSSPRQFTDLGTRMVLLGFDDARIAPFVSDGTPGGTSALLDPLETGSIFDIASFNEFAIFVLQDAGSTTFWRTDGTASGTVELFEGVPDIDVGFPQSFAQVNDHFYLAIETPDNGIEPWVLSSPDGDPELLVDALPGSGSSFPESFTQLGDYAVFSAFDAVTGRWQLWFTNGTAECTSLVEGGVTVASNADFTVVGDRVYFIGDDGSTGEELYLIELDFRIVED